MVVVRHATGTGASGLAGGAFAAHAGAAAHLHAAEPVQYPVGPRQGARLQGVPRTMRAFGSNRLRAWVAGENKLPPRTCLTGPGAVTLFCLNSSLQTVPTSSRLVACVQSKAK